MDHVICTHCHTDFEGKHGSTFLGFKKYRCPSCSSDVIYPLRLFPRIIFYPFVLGAIVRFVKAYGEGGLLVPGVLGVLMGYAVVRDLFIVDRVRRLKQAHALRSQHGETP